MDSLKKRQEITALIDNIKTHSDRLTNKTNIPILELSVILSKINRLQEKTVVLKFLMANEKKIDINEFDQLLNKRMEDSLEEELDTIQPISEKIAKKPENRTIPTEGSDVDPTIKNETKTNKKEDISTEAEILEQTNPVKKEIIADIERSKTISGDSDIPDLNKQYAEDEDPSLGEQLKKQPISDLMTAIGLNERYLFANELFEGEMEKFREAIKTLNEFEKRIEAIQYFNQTLMPMQQWEADNEMVKALYLLVERRYQ